VKILQKVVGGATFLTHTVYITEPAAIVRAESSKSLSAHNNVGDRSASGSIDNIT